tara:strand:+ start:574 stop:747 length:174 start_codon:yes stop_codon:yes gene_type:complete
MGIKHIISEKNKAEYIVTLLPRLKITWLYLPVSENIKNESNKIVNKPRNILLGKNML